MAFTKTLTQFSNRVQFLADIRGQVSASAAARHPQDDVFELANDDYRSVRSEVTGLGFSELLVATDPASLSLSAQAAGEQFSVETSPSGAISVRGVDILANGDWVSLKRTTWQQRRTREVASRKDGNPSHWCELTIGSITGGTTIVPGKVAIFPLPTRASKFRVWYLPEHTPVTDGTHLFLYAEECWYDLHVAKTAWKIAAIRDNDAKKRAASLEKMMADARATMAAMIEQRQADGPVTQYREQDYNG